MTTTIYGNNNNEVLVGGNDNYIIYGYGGNDSIRGGIGNDTIYGGDGDDSILRGFSGNDYVYGEGGNDHIWLDSGLDFLFGGRGNDLYTLVSTQSTDEATIRDDSGVDTLDLSRSLTLAGLGANALRAEDSDRNGFYDRLVIEPDNASLISINHYFDNTEEMNEGNGFIELIKFQDAMLDTLLDVKNLVVLTEYSDIPNDSEDQNNQETDNTVSNNQIIEGTLGSDTLFGLSGDDELIGNLGDDELYGAEGDDILRGDEGHDILMGAQGNDELFGGDGNDILIASTGDDILSGDSGHDTLIGGDGSDVYLFDEDFGRDVIRDVSAETQLNFHQMTSELTVKGTYVQSGSSVVSWHVDTQVSSITAGAGNDEITLRYGDQEAFGFDGDDTFIEYTKSGNDHYDGGDGYDTVDYSLTKTPVYYNHGLSRIEGNGEYDTLSNIENVIGGNSTQDMISLRNMGEQVSMVVNLESSFIKNRETIEDGFHFFDIENFEGVIGSKFEDSIIGSTGNNILHGMEGDDTIRGAEGDDLMYGGTGNDRYFYGERLLMGQDQIRDTQGNDAIYFDLNQFDIAMWQGLDSDSNGFNDALNIVIDQNNSILIEHYFDNTLISDSGTGLIETIYFQDVVFDFDAVSALV